MAESGSITRWCNKGFGFIRPDGQAGGAAVFVHVSDIHCQSEAPQVGSAVVYDMDTDSKGRHKAVNVTGPNGAAIPGTFNKRHLKGYHPYNNRSHSDRSSRSPSGESNRAEYLLHQSHKSDMRDMLAEIGLKTLLARTEQRIPAAPTPSSMSTFF